MIMNVDKWVPGGQEDAGQVRRAKGGERSGHLTVRGVPEAGADPGGRTGRAPPPPGRQKGAPTGCPSPGAARRPVMDST